MDFDAGFLYGVWEDDLHTPEFRTANSVSLEIENNGSGDR